MSYIYSSFSLVNLFTRGVVYVGPYIPIHPVSSPLFGNHEFALYVCASPVSLSAI